MQPDYNYALVEASPRPWLLAMRPALSVAASRISKLL